MVLPLSEGLGLIRVALEVGERSAVHTGIQGQFSNFVHSAEAAAVWTTLVDLEVGPFADAEIFRHTILIKPNYFEGVRIRWYETMGQFQLVKDLILSD